MGGQSEKMNPFVSGCSFQDVSSTPDCLLFGALVLEAPECQRTPMKGTLKKAGVLRTSKVLAFPVEAIAIRWRPSLLGGDHCY